MLLIKSFLVVLVFVKFGTSSISEEKCLEYSKPFLRERIPENRSGGTSELQKVPTLPGEFPHVAALGFVNDENITIWGYCGGSLISERFVLTGRICILGNNKFPVKFVRLGVINLDNPENDPNVQTYNVIKRHEYIRAYRKRYHDIALLELETSVKFTKYVRPACLFNEFNLPRSLEVSVAGWGKTRWEDSWHSKIQNKVYLDLFAYDECEDNFKNLKPYGLLDKLMVCAGGRKVPKDTCQGDSGSPLHTYNSNDNMYEIIGITSFGRGCGIVGPRGIYTRVAAYVPWIESIVWSCGTTNTTAQELDEYIRVNGKPPKEIPCSHST